MLSAKPEPHEYSEHIQIWITQMQFGSNNHWPSLSSISDEHQIESRDSLETNKLAAENT